MFALVMVFSLPAMAQKKKKATPLFKSALITSKTKGHSVDINVELKGSKKLYLVVEDGGNYSCDWVNWVSPKLVGPKGELDLTKVKWKSAKVGWGAARVGKNAGGKPMVVNNKPVHGIGVHAPSVIEFDVPAGYTHFKGSGGLDQGGVEQQNGSATSVHFAVYNAAPPSASKKRGGGGNPVATEGKKEVPLELFKAPDDLEVTVWAQSPMFYNPTNMDIDHAGRIWVAEGVNYRRSAKRKEGDRIVVLEDKNGDGKADSSHVFVQEKFLLSPLGVAVLDNVIIVSQPPDMIVYTDVNRNLKFDPEVDKREVLLTGFDGRNHDHSLHSVVAGPDGKWYFNQGNKGAQFTDRSGKTFRIGSPYSMKQVAGKKSDDGHVYLGGFSVRMNPDGTNAEIIGHNYRNSYEQIITSMGDLFQNDNDDPPACRTTWVMEYGNAGFASADGKRSWGADRRFGQPTAVAEWRQDDPGTMPAGDVYGGGAPTGITYYENGALGEKYEGLLLSCESARNVVFGYHPKLEGAGFELKRFDFLTTNPEKDFAGADFRRGGMGNRIATLFRPADVTVGADGAIYVADWFDPRVGGHATHDPTLSGTIYRIAPKGFKPTNPKLDLDTTEGQIAALKSPAINVRNLGFTRLKAQGVAAIPALSKLLDHPNKYIAARAVWLLAQIGEKGTFTVGKMLDSADDPQKRILALRALRRANVSMDVVKIAQDKSPAVRREVAFYLRNQPASKSVEALVEIARGFDGKDRSYLEAIGIGSTGKEDEVYAAVVAKLGKEEPAKWSDAMAWIAWRLMTPLAVDALKARAMAGDLAKEHRERAIDALAFIEDSTAADAMASIANNAKDKGLLDRARYWVKMRNGNTWRNYGTIAKVKGLSKPGQIIPSTIPEEKEPGIKVADVLKLKGDVNRGKALVARCYMCHQVGKNGVEYGPNLTGYAKKFPREVVVQGIVAPSAAISLGYEGEHIVTKSKAEIMGRVLGDGATVSVLSMGALRQDIPGNQIKSRKKMKRSLMMSASQLGLTAQQVADIVAFLYEN